METLLSLNSDGSLLPENDETRALLGTEPRRFKLLPTSPHLLVGVRTPCEPVATEDERVILIGDVAGLPLVDLIVFLNQCRISGLLRVTAPDGERSLAFLEGELRGASSNLPAEKIGEVAVRLGLVQRQQLDELLALPSGSGRIGNLMVEKGLLQRHELYTCLRQQVTEIFQACLIVTDGTFALTNQKVGGHRSLNINTQGLLMDSMRQLDEMKEFRKRIPSSMACPKACKEAGAKLDPKEAQILLQCNGERTIIDLALMFRLSEFDTTKAVHHLLEQGYVEKEMVIASSEKALPSPAQVIDAFNEVFTMIFEVLRTLPNPPDILEETSNILQLQSELFPIFQGIQLLPDGTIPGAALLQNIAEQGANIEESSRNLFSTLSELMYFLLFEAGEQLDPAADEQLSARIKALLAPVEACGR